MEFLTTKRGGKKVIRDDFVYSYNSRKRSEPIGKYWKCEKENCNARITTVGANDVFYSESGQHGHPSDSASIRARNLCSEIRQKIRENPLQPVKRSYDTMVQQHVNNEEMINAIPVFKAIRHSLYNARREVIPKAPNFIGDVTIEGEWAEVNGERFLLFNNGVNDKILCFATDGNLERLVQADTWYMDGTFYTSPRHFVQLYTIHGFYLGKMFPLVYAFLPNKLEITYTRLFRLLLDSLEARDLIPRQNMTIQLDFELGAINAARNIFIDCQIRGCYFHYGQCIWRHAVDCGLRIPYQDPNDDSVRRLVKRAGALPLVPLAEIDDCWMNVMNDAPVQIPGVIRFMDYVTDTWMDDMAPTFSRAMWNHFTNDGPRTINNLEGWHRGLNAEMGRAHPNVFEGIQLIKQRQLNTSISIAQHVQPEPGRKKYRKMNERIALMKERYNAGEITVMQYIDCVKYYAPLQLQPAPNVAPNV